ncbi:MAG: sulfite exporter TauE/SafE family protein, partial [Deltaproteobacteria bacterium]|nr:sulfite exporter TauE/SafE family protein [Deltaproteobacteria bacterium]
SAAGGAGVMLGFGLGTAPSLLLVGAGASALRRWGQRTTLRRAAAALALIIGLTSIWWRAPVHQVFGGDPAPPACHLE